MTVRPGREADHRCSVYGLTIDSDIPLAGAGALPSKGAFASGDAPPGTHTAAGPDVTIGRMPASKSPPGARHGALWQATSDWLRLERPGGGAIFEVSRGASITYDVHRDADPDMVRAFLTGVCVPYLLRQRGEAVFHGTVIANDHRAVCLLGPPAAGATTTALAAARAGWTLVSDGAAVLRLTDDSVRALPGWPWTEAWPDSLDALGLYTPDVPPIRAGSERRRMPGSPPNAAGVGAIVLLRAAGPDHTGPMRLRGVHSIEALQHTFFGVRRGTAPKEESRLFAEATSLAAAVPIWQVTRPRSRASWAFDADDMWRRVEASVGGDE